MPTAQYRRKFITEDTLGMKVHKILRANGTEVATIFATTINTVNAVVEELNNVAPPPDVLFPHGPMRLHNVFNWRIVTRHRNGVTHSIRTRTGQYHMAVNAILAMLTVEELDSVTLASGEFHAWIEIWMKDLVDANGPYPYVFNGHSAQAIIYSDEELEAARFSILNNAAEA